MRMWRRRRARCWLCRRRRFSLERAADCARRVADSETGNPSPERVGYRGPHRVGRRLAPRARPSAEPPLRLALFRAGLEHSSAEGRSGAMLMKGAQSRPSYEPSRDSRFSSLPNVGCRFTADPRREPPAAIGSGHWLDASCLISQSLLLSRANAAPRAVPSEMPRAVPKPTLHCAWRPQVLLR